MSAGRVPQAVVIAGPNGAGKTSSAPDLLRDTVGIKSFVNADVIAQGLAGFRPESAAFEAGRVMLRRLEELARVREDFAFESTLAGRSAHRLLTRLIGVGYDVHIVYLWLPTPEMAVARVRRRVEAGGHHVPDGDSSAILEEPGELRSSLPHHSDDLAALRWQRTRWAGVAGTWRDDAAASNPGSDDVAGDTEANRGDPMSQELSREIGSIIRDGSAIDGAILAARRRVIRRHRRLGVPLVIWRDGRVVEVSPESVELPTDPDRHVTEDEGH